MVITASVGFALGMETKALREGSLALDTLECERGCRWLVDIGTGHA